jgi:2-oxoisovalerate dehydrogenase E1 component
MIPECELRSLYRALLLPRLVEEKMLRLLRQGKLSKWFSGIGQEAIACGVTAALNDDDWILPLHRNVGVFTTRGVDLEQLFRQLLFKEGGFTKGRDRTFHFGILNHHIVGMISHLAAMLPVADGLALAAQLRNERRVAAAFVGDGGSSEGDFHEAVNLAAVWKLPVIFVIENNQYGLSTPVAEQFVCADLASRAVGYGIPGVICDGNDLVAVHRATSEAAGRARRGEGPTLIEFKTFRMRGHEEASGTAYVAPALFEQWGARDPIVRFEQLLDASGAMPAEARAALRDQLVEKIDTTADRVLGAAEPRSSASVELADVYAPPTEGRGVDECDAAAPNEIRYVDAISDALRLMMRRNSTTLLMGQDVAEYGGVFKVTKGFVEEFGRARIRNTPII